MAKLVLHFLIIVNGFRLPCFIEMILKTSYLCKAVCDYSILDDNIRVQVKIKLLLPPGDIFSHFSNLLLNGRISIFINIHGKVTWINLLDLILSSAAAEMKRRSEKI